MIEGLDGEFWAKLLGGLVVIVGTAIFGRSAILRTTSKDKVVLAADDGHVQMIAVLREERNYLVERLDALNKEKDTAVNDRAEAMSTLGGLRQKVETLELKIVEQSTTILTQAVAIESLQKMVNTLQDYIESLVGARDIGMSVQGGIPHNKDADK